MGQGCCEYSLHVQANLLSHYSESQLVTRLPRSSGKESAHQCRRCRRPGFNLWVRRSPGEGNGHPLQYSCLENFMGRGAWWASPCSPKLLDTTEWLSLSLSRWSLRWPMSHGGATVTQVPWHLGCGSAQMPWAASLTVLCRHCWSPRCVLTPHLWRAVGNLICEALSIFSARLTSPLGR